MISCSQLHSICTNRPVDNSAELQASLKILMDKVSKNRKWGDPFSLSDIDKYADFTGLKLVTKKYIEEKAKQDEFKNDSLSPGAMNFLQKLWLKKEAKLYSVKDFPETFGMSKGTKVEDDAIILLGKALNRTDLVKNTERKTVGFLTGECDLVYSTYGMFGQVERHICDIKSAIDHITFKEKKQLESNNMWQLIGYCHLWGADSASIVNCLMPHPMDIISKLLVRVEGEGRKKMIIATRDKISNLPTRARIKIFPYQGNLQSDIRFMLSRLDMAKKYYNTLNILKCLGHASA